MVASFQQNRKCIKGLAPSSRFGLLIKSTVFSQSLWKVVQLLLLRAFVCAHIIKGVVIVEKIPHEESLPDTPSAINNDELRTLGIHAAFQFFHFTFSSDECIHIGLSFCRQKYINFFELCKKIAQMWYKNTRFGRFPFKIYPNMPFINKVPRETPIGLRFRLFLWLRFTS